jgi:hypothetical protein
MSVLRCVLFGVAEGYPLCCIREFVADKSMTYGTKRYRQDLRRGLSPLWSGTGYVPCLRCSARFTLPRM